MSNATNEKNLPQQRLFGLFNKKERWGLSWRGALVTLFVILVVVFLFFLRIHSFLAVTEHEDARYLVVEGWVHQFAAKAAAAEFKSGHYQRVFVTGLPVEGSGEYDGNDSDTESYVGAGLLKRAGIPEDMLQRVPRRKVDRDRTYGSALALRAWFNEHDPHVQAINILTEAPHARRTRLLFQEALGPDVKVGIIAAQSPDYDPRRWWLYSEGVREVLGETIAWLYAEFLFHPDKNAKASAGQN